MKNKQKSKRDEEIDAMFTESKRKMLEREALEDDDDEMETAFVTMRVKIK